MFGTSLKLSDLKRLEQIQYKAGKRVSGALHLSSTEKLTDYQKDEIFFTIREILVS